MPKLIYLASPYSHENKLIEQKRFDAVCETAADLFRGGHFVFSPIAHTHPIAEYGLPKGFDFYEQYDKLMLSKCDELWVLRLDGWEESVGVNCEILYAENNNIPVRYI